MHSYLIIIAFGISFMETNKMEEQKPFCIKEIVEKFHHNLFADFCHSHIQHGITTSISFFAHAQAIHTHTHEVREHTHTYS